MCYFCSKLIGARYYTSESTRDEEGHGTHTTSTVAGSAVNDVSFYGLSKGTARGGVPGAKLLHIKSVLRAKITIYILAAFDDAIADGELTSFQSHLDMLQWLVWMWTVLQLVLFMQ